MQKLPMSNEKLCVRVVLLYIFFIIHSSNVQLNLNEFLIDS